MNIVTTRFGLLQVPETDVIRIPDGLVGFRSFTHYIHMPDPVVAGLSWLQSVTAPELAFGLVPPPLAISDYRIELRPGDRTALELDEERSAVVYVILNRGEGGPDGQPPGTARVQPGASARPATGADLESVRGEVSSGAPCPSPHAATRSDPASRDGLTGPATGAAGGRRPPQPGTSTRPESPLRIPSPVVVTESPGNVVTEGHGSRW